MSDATSIRVSLFSLRVTLFVLMIAWAVLKVINPASYGGEGIFSNFYGIGVGNGPVYAIGGAQILFLMAYVLGLFKTITTGGVLLMNTATLLVSLPRILDPFAGGPNLLFVASVPILGASLAHFLMRKHDTLLSLGKG